MALKHSLLLLRSLYSEMNRARFRQLISIIGLMLACALAEAFTIGATLPFLSLLTGSAATAIPSDIVEALAGARSPIVIAALLLAGAALVLMVLRLALLWQQQSFAMHYGRELSALVFARMLRQPYLAYRYRNSSDMLAGIEKTERFVQALLSPLIQCIVAAVIALFVIVAMLLVDATAALIAAAAIGSALAFVNLLTRRRLDENSRVIASAVPARNRTVREALGSIRDVLLDGTQDLHQARYATSDFQNRRAQAENAFISQAPRYVVEAVGVITMAAVALLLSRGAGGMVAAIPVLGALALGGQRLLPLLQQVWAGYSQLCAHTHWLRDVVELLNIPVEEQHQLPPFPPMRVCRQIEVQSVWFAYRQANPIFCDLNITIEAGEHVGLTGRTGSGKSTLADLVMGLLQPDRGTIFIDGRPLDGALRRRWQANIAHVPQSIYLIDAGIAANIALGVPFNEVDWVRLEAVARAAQLDTFVASLADGWHTGVGERGVQLSGGQRQRIGLARALYRNAGLLVLDEATSALDPETEQAIVSSIRELDSRMTVITITHRPAALALCDRVIDLGKRGGSTEELRLTGRLRAAARSKRREGNNSPGIGIE